MLAMLATSRPILLTTPRAKVDEMQIPTLFLGEWQQVFATWEFADALITDPPFSEQTVDGHNARERDPEAYQDGFTSDLEYGFTTPLEAREFVRAWSERCGWLVIITDHILWGEYDDAARECDRYTFAPIPWVVPGKGPRLAGDGPASWSCFVHVSRPKSLTYSRWRSLPGAYITRDWAQGGRLGGKPLSLMRALVRDYSNHNDLILDPFAGSASTLIAAFKEGRRAIGCEAHGKTYEDAARRLRDQTQQQSLAL